MHPATPIIAWLLLACAVAWLSWPALVVLGLACLAFSGYRGRREFLRFTRRTRWLLLSLVIIYGFVTPGEALVATGGIYSPTLEGLSAGGMQALRLTALLAGLSWLLAVNDRGRLLSGLFALLKPLSWTGLDAERVAARLWLTLHYSETLEKRSLEAWWQEASLAMEEHAVETLSLDRPVAGWTDALVVSAVVTGLLLGVLA